MIPNRKPWLQRKIALLKEKRKEFKEQKIQNTVQQIKKAVAHGESLTPEILAWLEKFDKGSVVPVRILDISNQIKKNHEPSSETLAWLKEFDKESIVPAGFRDLNVDTEWRWVWDEYPLNQFRIALKFAPQQENLQQVVDGLHELVNIPVSDYHRKERVPLRQSLTQQIFQIITGEPFAFRQGYGVENAIENERRAHFSKFIERCLYAYESVSPERRKQFDRALVPDVKKERVVAPKISQQQR